MEYQVVIEEFQGPLDLLLHLIKEKEMDLETLELSVIADQYLQYIHAMEPSLLEVMSEYLVMAADLIEMKSKMLLPKEKVVINDEPKILGDSTGLSAFWVVFSILLGGGLFGFAGMIAGVPTFAVIYYIVKMAIEQKLEKKRMPMETESYGKVEYLDENGEFQYLKDDTKESTDHADSSTK